MNAVVKIEQRLDRVRLGNLGNSKSVGEGVCELKIDFGPGIACTSDNWGQQ